MPKMCHCGKPLHYTDKRIKAFIEKMIQQQGEFITITVLGDQSYRVPRHYVALHGIKGSELADLGFERVN